MILWGGWLVCLGCGVCLVVALFMMDRVCHFGVL